MEDARPSASLIRRWRSALAIVSIALPFDFRLLQHGGDQFAFAARDFGVLHLHLRFGARTCWMRTCSRITVCCWRLVSIS